MVAWLSPGVLARTGLGVALSGVFANFADKRETEAALRAEMAWYTEPEDGGPFWLDYASDLGDGFDTTYTVARMLAKPKLCFGEKQTERGQALVLGGDQVYPSASFKAYDERFGGPYAAAFPEGQRDARPPPDLFALPGNHDWYDGLTSFMRVFCQGARIGNWQTRQARSYFALRLPHNWWLWGIDIQFDSYIDGPQLDYFRRVATHTSSKDRIILATAKPSWVHVTTTDRKPQSWMSLTYFEETILRTHGAELAVTLTGDLHHYSRYEPAHFGGPKITAGGGGAYLSPTHPLPKYVDLPRHETDETMRYELKHCWPSMAKSDALRYGLLRLISPRHTVGLNVLLFVIYGALALAFVWGIQDDDAALIVHPYLGSLSLLGDGTTTLRVLFVAVIGIVLDGITVVGVISVAVIGIVLVAWAAYGEIRPWRAGLAAGLLHLAFHLVAILILSLLLVDHLPLVGDVLHWRAVALTPELAESTFPPWGPYLIAGLIGLCGCLVGRVVVVFYLLGTHGIRCRWHSNEVFAAQSRQAGTRFKHFLRLRIDTKGLKIYAIGVDDVPSKWTEGARPEPEGQGEALPTALMVDDTVTITRDGLVFPDPPEGLREKPLMRDV